MNNIAVDALLTSCKNELDHVRTSITSLGLTSTITPYLTNYAVIKACGTIEVSFKSLLADFCNKRSKKQIKRFIDKRVVNGSANPSYVNLLKFLDHFDADWKKNFKANLDADPNKTQIHSSLQSLVDARNEFAHGGTPTITITDVITHFNNSRKAIEHMDFVIV